MSKTSEIEKIIPAIYKRSALNLLMFGFVTGVRKTLHTISIQQAIYMFMDYYDLTDEEYNSDSAQVIFNRMSKELNINLKK